jgi:hypothetical protein
VLLSIIKLFEWEIKVIVGKKILTYVNTNKRIILMYWNLNFNRDYFSLGAELMKRV